MLLPKPKLILDLAEKIVPKRVWKAIDRIRAKNKKNWPSWCYLPFQEFVNSLRRSGVKIGNPIFDLPTLHLMTAWRASQGIYRIHDDFCPELLRTRMGRAIPLESLYLIPEWCVYVEFPSTIRLSGRSYIGLFATLCCFDNRDHRPILNVAWVNDRNFALGAQCLPLFGTLRGTVEAMSQRGMIVQRNGEPQTVSRLSQQESQDLESRLNIVLPVLSYLGATNADIRSSVADETPPPKAIAINSRKVPSSPRIWNVGYRVGPALRNHREVQGLAGGANSSGARPGFSMRPHVRRAHWHHFWTGSTLEPSGRGLELRWLHPILVNVRDSRDLIPTVREVEGSS